MKPDKVHCEPCGWEAENAQYATDHGWAYIDWYSGALDDPDFIKCYICDEPLSWGAIDPAMKEVQG